MLQIDFIEPKLTQIDRTPCDLLVAFFFENHEFLEGLLSTLDWRLLGTLSSKLIAQKFSGGENEKILLSTNQKFHFDKILLLGLGDKDQFNHDKISNQIKTLHAILEKNASQNILLHWPISRQKKSTTQNIQIDQLLLQLSTLNWTFLKKITAIESSNSWHKISEFLKKHRSPLQRGFQNTSHRPFKTRT